MSCPSPARQVKRRNIDAKEIVEVVPWGDIFARSLLKLPGCGTSPVPRNVRPNIPSVWDAAKSWPCDLQRNFFRGLNPVHLK